MNNYIYIAVMAAVSYMIRVLPLTLIRKPIKNQFIQCFGSTFHLSALIAGIIAAWLGAGLFPVSVICCVLVFVIELFVK